MKIKRFAFMFMILSALFTLNAHAYDTSYIDKQIDVDSILESLPQNNLDYLPNDVFDGQNVVEIAQNTEHGFLYSFIFNVIKNIIKPLSKTFCSLMGIILLSSLINTSKNHIASPNLSKTLTYITLIGTASFVYQLLCSLWESLDIFMSSMNILINSLIPIMTLLYTIGGNVSTAVVSTTGITITLTLLNQIYQNGLFPLMKICLGLSLAGIIGGITGISKITKTLKNIFSIILSGTMTLLSIFLLFKTNISAATDGAAARTVKFAGSFIPVIGSSLGESIRSIMASVSLIKSSAGFVGIIIILVITLPVILNILGNKICIDLSKGIASLLGSNKESALLEEFSSTLSFALAITVCIAVIFIFELTVFVSVSPALGAS